MLRRVSERGATISESRLYKWVTIQSQYELDTRSFLVPVRRTFNFEIRASDRLLGCSELTYRILGLACWEQAIARATLEG